MNNHNQEEEYLDFDEENEEKKVLDTNKSEVKAGYVLI
jgi:hypothetical protein